MNDSDVIRMRDYVDLRIAHVEQSSIQRELSNTKAIEIAAEELSRRLDDLNHAHEIARDKDITFVSRDMFDSALKDLNQRISAIEKIVWGFGAVVTFLSVAMPIILRLLKWY